MATAGVLAPRDVITTLNYYIPIGDEEPYHYALGPPDGKAEHNLGVDVQSVVVQDARGREDEFSLDKSGFQFVRWPSAQRESGDPETIKAEYYPEVVELLKEVAGARKVFIFDHTIRRKLDDPSQDVPGNRGPVERVHIDQTYEASVERVRRHFPEEADRLLKSRVRIINVWRPIHHPVAHKPLGVSDWRHLHPQDLVSVRYIYPDRTGSSFSVRYNPNHKWYYLSGQTPEEVTLIKCYDSEEDKARLTPHSAFADTTSPEDAPHRESIEVRALVFDTE